MQEKQILEAVRIAAFHKTAELTRVRGKKKVVV